MKLFRQNQLDIFLNLKQYGLLVLLNLILSVPGICADYYVNDDNTSGPWLGTMDLPFQTITDGLSVAQAGDDIHIAEGLYFELLNVTSGIAMHGGYRNDWEELAPFSYLSVVDGGGGEAAITLNDSGSVNGMVVENAQIGITSNIGIAFTVQNCWIRSCAGHDGEDASIENPPGTGASSYGIKITGADITIFNNLIENIVGGNGGSGQGDVYTYYSGASGGSAWGISLEVSSYTATFSVTGNRIFAIRGGHGGLAGAGGESSLNGGDGGSATGIDCALFNLNNTITGNIIESVISGDGGNSQWGHMIGGNGGNAGNAWGIKGSNISPCDLQTNMLTMIIGGNGGDGGSSGDFPGSGDPGNGGLAGNATGVSITDSQFCSIFNHLITNIQGGNGGDGGDTMALPSCGVGAGGGSATAILLDSIGSTMINCTVYHISGGSGGAGGMAYGYPVSKQSQDSYPSSTATGTPTATPTFMPGVQCCGSGGAGGAACGVTVVNIENPELFLSNIISLITGGSPGQCDNPTPGAGYGFFNSTGSSVNISYHDIDQCSTGNLFNAQPGPGFLSDDPLFATGPSGNFYLSAVAAGQPTDSPCIDGGDSDADEQYWIPGFFCYTHHMPDTGLVDIGFHYFVNPGPACINNGDVDGSGQLTPNDALLSFQIYLGIIPSPTADQLCSADCNGNSNVTPEDALCIFLNYVSGACQCAD